MAIAAVVAPKWRRTGIESSRRRLGVPRYRRGAPPAGQSRVLGAPGAFLRVCGAWFLYSEGAIWGKTRLFKVMLRFL